MASHSHSHEGQSHSHAAADHGHSHEILDGPGSFLGREMPIIEGRDWKARAFTIGIGGYVCPFREFVVVICHEPIDVDRVVDFERVDQSVLARPP